MSTESAVVVGNSRRLSSAYAAHDRPCVRVGGRFAGEVASIEFFDGGVDVVEVEHDARHDPLFGVDLSDAEHRRTPTSRRETE